VGANSEGFARPAPAEEQFFWYEGMREILFRLLDPMVAGRSVRSALDCGVGGGDLARTLQSRYEWYVAPVEMDNLQQFETLPARLPFSDGEFDAVLSLDFLAYLSPQREPVLLREMVRVLAPGGLMVLRAPALKVLRSRHSQYVGERQRFTRSRLVSLVERHGIRVLRSTYANALLAPVALAKFRVWEPLLRRRPASGVIRLPSWLDRSLLVPLKLEAGWLGAGLNLPIGQNLIVIGEKTDTRA
jgi:SAM-dependent methyltransferase